MNQKHKDCSLVSNTLPPVHLLFIYLALDSHTLQSQTKNDILYGKTKIVSHT